MKYPLPAMTVNKKECKHTMQTIVKFGLTKTGISSTLHTAVSMGLDLLEELDIFTSSFFKVQDK